jgi:MFS family permease
MRDIESATLRRLTVRLVPLLMALYFVSASPPSIISGFKKTFGVQLSLLQVGLITAVPYTIAAVAMFFWSRHADRHREHVWHVAAPLLLGGAAIPLALYLGHPVAVMVPVTLAAVGIYSALPVFWALPSRFLTGAAAAGGSP